MSLDIRIWDVNHGNSASIKLPNGNIMMIDCASNPLTNFSPILRTKTLWGESLGYLIITHPHMDHIRDITNIDSYKPTVLHRPKIDYSFLREDKSEEDLEIINKYIDFQAEFTEPVKSPNAPTKPWREDVEIMNYYLKGDHVDLNNYSLVTFISYGAFHFATAGDITTDGWKKLIEQEGDGFLNRLSRVNFFQASHHGRKNGFNSIIFKKMDPYLIFISDKHVQDTDASSRYRAYCQGWDVLNEITSDMIERKVLTTRNDGRIKITVNKDKKTYVDVSTRLP